MNHLKVVGSCIILVGLWAPAGAASDAAFLHRWNAHGFYVKGSSMAETNAGLAGGGAGFEAFFWKRLTAAQVASPYGSREDRWPRGHRFDESQPRAKKRIEDATPAV